MVLNIKKLGLLKIIITLILFYGAFQYEDALRYRATIFIVIFLGYIILNISRKRIKSERFKMITYILELSLIFMMEHNSRYLINYTFHIFYFLTLLEVPLNLNRKNSISLSTITIIVSSIKFIILLYNKPNFWNFSQSGFFIITGIFIMLLMNFVKYYKDEKESKEKLYKELINAEDKLKQMAVIEERNRIARDIHDTIGHSMTGTIMGLEMVQVLMEEDMPKAKEMVKYLKENSRENLVKVREVVSTLSPNENISKGLESINDLIETLRQKTNIEINLDIEGAIIKLDPATNIIIYRTIQESLTNAIRHGKPSVIDIFLKYSNTKINLIIKDNGIGCKDITKGYGLKGMEDRILSTGGNVIFSSHDGFIIEVNIPLEVKND